MCKCTPNIRTPFCGKLGCEWPKPEGVRPPSTGAPDLGDELRATEAALEAAQSRLEQWGEMFGPVLEFGQRNSEALGIRLGDSISKYVLDMLKAKAALPLQPAGDLREGLEDHPARTLLNLIIGTAQGAAAGSRDFAGKDDDDPHVQTYKEIEGFASRALALLGGGKKGEGEPTDADLLPYGWAPGWYVGKCRDCEDRDDLKDKRASVCRPCAVKRFLAKKGEPVAQGLPAPAARVERETTHSAGCWSWHHDCARARLERVQDYLRGSVLVINAGQTRDLDKIPAYALTIISGGVESPPPATRSDEVAEGTAPDKDQALKDALDWEKKYFQAPSNGEAGR